MKLELLRPNKGSVKNNTRQGRGQGSGGGGTARRGHKGAKSRSGYSSKRGFEGGQMPLQRRLPKFGFNNINRVEYKAINLDALQGLFDKTSVSEINLQFLKENGLIQKFDLVKILGRGELTAKLNVSAHAFSKSAIEIIASKGGSTSVVAKKVSSNVDNIIPAVKVDKIKPAKIVDTKIEGAIPLDSNTEIVSDEPVVSAPIIGKIDDLKIIEGIGPKIAELLIADGISTYATLASTSSETLSAILEKAGSRYASHNPTTWPEQAQLAADGKMDELKELQDRLQGGRPE